MRNLICWLKSFFSRCFLSLSLADSSESTRSFDSKLQAVSKNHRKNLRFFPAKQVAHEVYWRIGARKSPLSRAQMEEFIALYRLQDCVEPIWFDTAGDLDKVTSLRGMEKSDFFTREIDDALLKGEIDWALHSRKDLPDPLPEGLCLLLETEAIDERDSLVFRKEIFAKMKIGTSSKRRENAALHIVESPQFFDLRGTIEERLALVETGVLDGVVIAEAALIRLKKTAWPRVFLPGKGVEGQGRLALVGRVGAEYAESALLRP